MAIAEELHKGDRLKLRVITRRLLGRVSSEETIRASGDSMSPVPITPRPGTEDEPPEHSTQAITRANALQRELIIPCCRKLMQGLSSAKSSLSGEGVANYIR